MALYHPLLNLVILEGLPNRVNYTTLLIWKTDVLLFVLFLPSSISRVIMNGLVHL
jgi:hypothetical protein